MKNYFFYSNNNNNNNTTTTTTTTTTTNINNNNNNDNKQGVRIISNSEDSIKFWSDIWSIRKENNQQVE